jgi:hypothetical protein
VVAKTTVAAAVVRDRERKEKREERERRKKDSCGLNFPTVTSPALT